jgi:hypothetical protein
MWMYVSTILIASGRNMAFETEPQCSLKAMHITPEHFEELGEH